MVKRWTDHPRVTGKSPSLRLLKLDRTKPWATWCNMEVSPARSWRLGSWVKLLCALQTQRPLLKNQDHPYTKYIYFFFSVLMWNSFTLVSRPLHVFCLGSCTTDGVSLSQLPSAGSQVANLQQETWFPLSVGMQESRNTYLFSHKRPM